MSERSYEDRLAVRMLDAIDALPVPAGPRALHPRRTLVRQVDLRHVFVLLLVAVLATLGTPTAQSVVAEAGRIIQRLIGTPPWTAYYVDSPDSGSTWRLMFANGSFPGKPTQPDIVSLTCCTAASHSGERWSPDGELLALATGAKIYVADRMGRVREVADAGGYRPVIDVAWTGRRQISAVVRDRATFTPQAGVTADLVMVVDAESGRASQRPLPAGIRIDPRLGHVWGTFSPSGRWLTVPDRFSLSCGSMRIVDLEADRVVEMADGVSRRAIPIGWLRNDRLVWGTCIGPADAPTALNIFVGAPGADGRSIGSVPWSTTASATGPTQLQGVPVVDIHRDRILISSVRRDHGEPGAVWSLDLSGQLTQVVRLPRASDLEPDGGYSTLFVLRSVSRDGRWLAFHVTAQLDGTPAYVRSGIIDLTSGAIAWACAAGSTAGGRYTSGPACHGLSPR